MSDKETIPLLNIKTNQTTQQVQISSTKNTSSTTHQFTGYGRAVSAWCGYMKK